MITSDTNFRGNFDSIEAVWEAIPYGGVEGDYLNIQGVKYRWNKFLAMWENAEVVTETPARETVTFDEDVNMQNNLTVAGVLRAKKFVVDDLPTGIEDVEITESAVSGGNNVITFTYTNGETQTFNIKNGEAGKTMGAFGYASSTASQSTWDTAKNYLVPTATEGEFYVYTYEDGAWYQVDTFQVDIAGTADAVEYDDTTTQLGADNVQEAIEVLKTMAEETTPDRTLYMLKYILSNALYVSDQAYNIDVLFNSYKESGDIIKVPEGSQDGETLAVTLTSETGTSIYYTLDGSIPTKKDGIVYSAPFVPVEDCIVKAIAYGTGNLKSLMVSFTVKGSGIIVFKDANLEAVAKAATTADVVVTLPDSSTITVKGLGWDKDHDGVISVDDMRQVTSLPAAPGTTFNQNQWIQYLDVLRYARFTSCGRYAFNQCPNLKELTIPKTCTTTQAESIKQCPSLQRLVFEEGVTNVASINNCNVAKMKLPNSLTTFGGITNGGTSLSASGGLVIPKNVTAFPSVYNTKVGRIKHLGNITTIPMGNLSYAGNTEVYLASNVVPTKTGTASNGAITMLFVPDEMIPLYAESADWATMYNNGDIVSINNWVD